MPIILLLLLSGCATGLVPVERRQDYQPPADFTVRVISLSPANVAAMCAGLTNIGCAQWLKPREAWVWVSRQYDAKSVLAHEFEHIIFGPKHR